MTWLFLILDCVERGILRYLLNLANNVVLVALFWGMAYVIGMLFDRIANAVFQKRKNTIRKESGLQAKSCLLVAETNKMKDHQAYTRSKYRILRSSSINIPLISIFAICNICLNYTNIKYLVIAIILIGIILTLISVWSTINTIKNFFNKARVIELHNENTD